MNPIRPLAAAVATLALCACATSGGRTPADAVSRLEKDHAAKPGSAPTTRALGIAYYDAKRFPDAKATLQAADASLPNDGVIALYRGLTAEALGDFAGAKAAYSKYLAVGKTANVRKQIRDRLAAVARNELEASAKAAVARETELASEPGPASTIAVPPLTFSGTDTSLVPLERGVADLLITDLSRSKQLTVLERDRMQALLDEVGRSESGRIDQTTAVRAGKMLRAGSLVRGTIIQSGNSITLTTTATNVATSGTMGSATGGGELDALFDVEKQVALQIFDNLGIQLTDAERVLVQANRPTKSLRAFLAFSRGLMAEDRGDYFEAARLFESAGRIDPGFGAAALKQSGASSAAAGANVSSATVTAGLKGSAEGAVASAAANGVVAVGGDNSNKAAQAAVNDVNPSQSVATTTNTTTQSGGNGQPGAGGTSPPQGNKPAPGTQQPTDGGSARVIFIIRPPE